MSSQLSNTTLHQMIPLLGSLSRLIADGSQLDGQQLQLLLHGADLEIDPAPMNELQRWSRLLKAVQQQPTREIRAVTVEALLLRGIPEATALLAVATVADKIASAVVGSATDTTHHLRASVEMLDFGILPPNQPVTTEFEIFGGPGQVIVDSDHLRVIPLLFGAETTRIHIEVKPLAGSLLWTALKLVSANATVEVPVMAQWAASADPQTGSAIVITPGANEEESGARLAEALAKASPGTALYLQAGIYQLSQPLVIDKPISLTGAGLNQTRLLCAAERCVALLSGEGPFVVADMSFELDFCRFAQQGRAAYDLTDERLPVGGSYASNCCATPGGRRTPGAVWRRFSK